MEIRNNTWIQLLIEWTKTTKFVLFKAHILIFNFRFRFIPSSKLDENFNVNNNSYNTQFLLSLDYSVWLSCLVIPKTMREFNTAAVHVLLIWSRGSPYAIWLSGKV